MYMKPAICIGVMQENNKIQCQRGEHLHKFVTIQQIGKDVHGPHGLFN